MKSQQEILTFILITAILILVVLAAYLWGFPLIQKNRDITTLQRAENFMKNLNNRIKQVANTEGRDILKIDVGTLTFDSGILSLEIETGTTIYEPGRRIYFIRNTDCHIYDLCKLGEDEAEILYAESRGIDGKYLTKYTLTYRKLNTPATSYKIALDGNTQISGSDSNIIMSYKGKVKNDNTITTMVEIRIV